MATRFYLPYTGYTPTVGTGWSAGEGWSYSTATAVVQRSYTTASGDAMTTHTSGIGNTGVPFSLARWVSLLLLPGQSLTGTVVARARVLASRASSGAVVNEKFAMSVHVIRDGVVRHSATGLNVSSRALDNTTLLADEVSASLASYTTVSGDRLVLMLGFSGPDTYGVNYEIRLGSSAASDIATLGSSTDLRPYVEFSQTLTFDTSVNAATGSFTASGQNAQLTALRLPLVGDAGAVVVAGQDAAFSIGKRVAADAGSFVVAGETSGLLATRVIVPDAGAFTLAGQASGLNHGSASQIDAGAFVVDGQDAGFVVGKGVAAGTGVFVVNGQDAALVYSGTPPVTGNGTQCDTLAWMLIDEPGGSW
ncbi:hypothetical protein UFOVP466_74 [uncultured Caudovirales phage]|uniref:Uncharacterized protein n=1 Tax=uncultured Caudovirales phage TaxID=2100421 RepID=A0A6J5T4S4_9CAUD|nr:hypothetical protein UFOVP466_74 [uncultured Caudovirales phage]CAB4180376.1 hypothetical protein UFOVP1045_21 [uncultured Caudovirales phage]CAB4190590.1 hypothetical protein UFOVP1194_75 [uncultured Caudovirales phage]CAB4221834.1 hypothetical protein UFOVP1641_71 [uncultured Caudovirales phage]